MTPYQIGLVQKSWRQVLPISDTAAALLWTLGHGLGDAFTPEVKEAWTETYTALSRTMKDAVAEA